MANKIHISCVFNLLIIEVVEDYRHPEIVMSSGYPLEIDYFFPNLNLAFEYQV